MPELDINEWKPLNQQEEVPTVLDTSEWKPVKDTRSAFSDFLNQNETLSFVANLMPTKGSKQFVLDLFGGLNRVEAGFIKGATLGIIDPLHNTLGVPFTSLKYQYAEPMTKAMERQGMSKTITGDNALTKTLDIGGELVGGIAMPIGGLERNINTGLKFLARGKDLTMGYRVAGSMLTGGILGAAYVKDEGQTLAGDIFGGAIMGGLFHLGGELVYKIAQTTGLNRLKPWKNFQEGVADFLYTDGRFFTSRDEAKTWTSTFLNQELKAQGGLKNLDDEGVKLLLSKIQDALTAPKINTGEPIVFTENYGPAKNWIKTPPAGYKLASFNLINSETGRPGAVFSFYMKDGLTPEQQNKALIEFLDKTLAKTSDQALIKMLKDTKKLLKNDPAQVPVVHDGTDTPQYTTLEAALQAGVNPLKVDPLTYAEAVDPGWQLSANPKETLGFKALQEHLDMVNEVVANGYGKDVAPEVFSYYDRQGITLGSEDLTRMPIQDIPMDNFIPTEGQQKIIDDYREIAKKPELTLEEQQKAVELVQKAKDAGIPIDKMAIVTAEEKGLIKDPEQEILEKTYDLVKESLPKPLTEEELKSLSDKILDSLTSPNAPTMKDTGFNPTKIAPEDTVRIIRAAADKYKASMPKSETLAETEAKAKSIASEFGLGSLAQLKQANEEMSDLAARLVAWKAYMAKVADQVDKYANLIESGTATELDYVKFEYLCSYLKEAVPLVKGIQTSAAQATSAGRIPVAGDWVSIEDITPDFIRTHQDIKGGIDTIIDRFGGIEKIKANVAKWKAQQTVAGKVKSLPKEHPILNALVEQQMTSVLSGFDTIKRSFLGNMGTMITRIIEENLEFAIGHLRGNPEAMSNLELSGRMFGDCAGLVEALIWKPSMIVQDAKTGIKQFVQGKSFTEWLSDIADSPEALERSIEAFTPDVKGMSKAQGMQGRYISSANLKGTRVGGIINEAGRTILDPSLTTRENMWKLLDIYGAVNRTLGFGGLQVADAPFKFAAYESEVFGLAMKEGFMRGLRNEELGHFALDLADQIRKYRDGYKFKVGTEIDQARAALIQKIDQQATVAAREAVMERQMTGISRELEKRMRNPYAKLLFNLFYKVPVSTAQWTFERLPAIGLLAKRNRVDLAGINGQRGIDRAIARQVLGSILTTGTLLLALNKNSGVIGQIEPNMRQAYSAAGINEYSIKTGGNSVGYANADPVSTFLMLGSDIGLAANEAINNDPQWVQTLALMVGNMYAAKTYGKGLADIMQIFTDPTMNTEAKIQRWAMDKVRATVPLSGFTKSIQNAQTIAGITPNPFYDPYVKEIKDFNDMFSSSKRPQLDWLGKPMKNSPTSFGLKDTEIRTDSPIRMEVVRLNLPETQLTDTILPLGPTSVKLDNNQYWAIRKLLDTKLHMEDYLNKVVTSEAYQRINNAEVKRNLLSGLISEFKTAAQAIYLKEDPAVIEAYKNNIENYKRLYLAEDSVQQIEAFRSYTQSSKMQRADILSKEAKE